MFKTFWCWFDKYLPLCSYLLLLFVVAVLLWIARNNESILYFSLVIVTIVSSQGIFFLLTRTIQLRSQLGQLQMELKESANREAYLSMLSYTDTLTGIPNLRYFQEHFNRKFQEALEKRVPISVALVDVDLFKKLNDTFGHQVGDQCLIEIAQAIHNEIKSTDHFVARYGGEEFIIVMFNIENNEAVQLSERIRQKIESIPIAHINNHPHIITISIGVASLFPIANHQKDLLIRLADQSLYTAKQHGRNKVVGAV